MEKNDNKTKVYNLIILDKSGSMSSIAKAAIAGFNETVGGIRSAQSQFSQTQAHFVSLLPFCQCEMEYIYNCVPVDNVAELSSRQYRPCCSTPLYDAMGKGINDMLKRTKDEDDAMVTVTIITDGMENASREYSGKAIKALVDKMRDEYGWSFSYIGTNQDVEAVASSLSIRDTMFFEDTAEGMTEAWERERKAVQRMYADIDVAHNMCPTAGSRTSMIRNILSRKRKYLEKGEFSHRVTPFRIDSLRAGQVFVFGSDGMGSHSGGAARLAVERFHAVVGQAEGMQGQSYAIDSMDGISILAQQAERFILYAAGHPEKTFLVTRIGCGVAGFTPRQVAPLFVKAVDVENIWLPEDFWDELV